MAMVAKLLPVHRLLILVECTHVQILGAKRCLQASWSGMQGPYAQHAAKWYAVQ